MAVSAGGHIEVNVLGVCQGEEIANQFYYYSDFGNGGTFTLSAFLTEFIANWRTARIAVVADLYSVAFYQARQISGMVFLPVVPPASPTSRPALRFSEQVIVAGTASDVGDIAAASGEILPTFNAISVQKICGPVTDPINGALTNEKLLSGACRIGPVFDDDTEVGAPNVILAARRTTYRTAMLPLLAMTVSAQSVKMEVLSFIKDGVHRVSGTDPTFARAQVTDFVFNPNCGSQVSRKASNRIGA